MDFDADYDRDLAAESSEFTGVGKLPSPARRQAGQSSYRTRATADSGRSASKRPERVATSVNSVLRTESSNTCRGDGEEMDRERYDFMDSSGENGTIWAGVTQTRRCRMFRF